MSLAPGVRLGPYEIVAPLGAGGMGEVWRARDLKLDREVALKFLPATFVRDPERLARFEREAKVLASLNHPNIAAIYGFHEHEGHLFLAMELVSGVDLQERLTKGRLPLSEAIEIARQIAAGLEAAHERGVVHRDLKPANVKATEDGTVKVLDFGLAKALDAAATSDPGRDASMSPTITSLGTVAGVILGTAAYMSPEQARGKSVDRRADIWALGCVLYEMLTGSLAFSGETVSDTMASVLTREPDWSALPADVPRTVRELLTRCLRKDPKERLRDAGDARIELTEALRGERGPVPIESIAPRSRPRWIVPALVVAAIAAVVGGAWVGRRSATTTPPQYRTLSFGNGFVHSARFTPDGQTVLYGAAFEGRPLALFSTRVDGFDSRPVDVPSSDIAGISKNGQLALLLGRHFQGSWRRIGTLGQVALTGGTPRELLESVYDADISPDGTRFAVVVADGDDQVLQYPMGHEVFRNQGWISQPRIAPDGKRIAFVDHRLPGDDLGVVKLAGPDAKITLLGPEQQYVQGVCWSADGGTVFYSFDDDDGAGTVSAVSPGGTPRVAMRVPSNVRVQDAAADGRLLLVTDDTWVMLSGQLAGDKSERIYSWWAHDSAAGISMDGTSFAGTTGSIVVNGEYPVFVRRGTEPPIQLGMGATVGMTADGKSVFATSLSGGAKGLTMFPVGPGQPRVLDMGGVELKMIPGNTIRTSADGRVFAFIGAKPGTGRAAYVMNLTGGVPRKVSPEGASGVVVSPDGTKVVVGDPTRGMYVVSSAGNVPIQGAPKDDVPLGWTADNGSVLSWDATLPPRVFRTEITGGHRELFREIQPADPAGMTYGWLVLSPDGRFYLQRYRRIRSTVVLTTPRR